jgi:5'-3' exonuclease
MGIPSYFSYIVKNHTNIIKRYNKDAINVSNLYIDSNSIIYDVYNKLDIHNLTDDIAISIIQSVIHKIESYVDIVKPKKTLIIAFDGCAPVAKLKQQRIRRYKSWYQNEVSRTIFNKQINDPWNTASITPGTNFMNKLNQDISNYFNDTYRQRHNLFNVIFSGSNVPGEGEHKIFEYMRLNQHRHNNETTIIYGLDADLIMLSINHLSICPNIYLFRETPEFIKSIDNSLEPNQNYYLDIPELAEAIVTYMNNDKELTNDCKKCKIYDYVFLCFLLGNDFLPHFPAINIRNGGINKLIDAYKNTISTEEILTDGNQIYWQNFKKIISYLAEQEENLFKEEHNARHRFSRRINNDETPEQKYKNFELSPIYNRHLENYINPWKPYWRHRYYDSLFKFQKNRPNNDEIRKISINYLEGLEWTMKYYTSGCIDWRWKYKHNYPPLLVDLLHIIPDNSTSNFILKKTPKPVSELVQLCYVLPRSSLYLLPRKLSNELLKTYPNLYISNCEFIWAYCRYFWESHIDMHDIDISELEIFINNFSFNE